MDPLAARWAFARSHDGLHPTTAGSEWIARKVAEVLRSHSIAGPAAAGAPLVCDSGIHSERLRPPASLVATHARSRHRSRA
jgi:hypothetical protein